MPAEMSIRFRLLRDIVLILLFLGLSILTIQIIGAQRAARLLSEKIIDQSMKQVHSELNLFFQPIIAQLQTAQAWCEEGLLDLDEPNALNLLFCPVVEQLPQLSSLMIADERGNAHMILQTDTAWYCRRIQSESSGYAFEQWYWTNEDPRPVAIQADTTYDPQVRPWYTGALDRHIALKNKAITDFRDTLFWTEPYTFFTIKEPGITVSLVCRNPENKLIIIGFDLLLRHVTEFTRTMKILDHGEIAIVSAEDRLIAISHPERFSDVLGQQTQSLLPADISKSIYGRMRQALTSQNREDQEGTGSIDFRFNGQRWWTNGSVYRLNNDQHIRTAVLVPESDILGVLQHTRWLIAGLMGLVLIGAIVRAFQLAGRFSRPIESLVQQSDRIRMGDLEPGPPISSALVEVNRLVVAQDHMRSGLQALMKLERDLQLAQQIQRGIMPRQLPRLKGYDLAAWNQPADQTGGDIYDVVGFQGYSNGAPIRLTHDKPSHTVLLLADATGHGIGPALSVTQFRAMLRMALRLAPRLEDVIQHINSQLTADLADNRFITAWLGELNVAEHRLSSFSAGQGPLLYYQAATDTWTEYPADTYPLGINDPLDNTKPQVLTMQPGDLFAVISDGIFEANNGSRTMYGSDRAKDLLRRYRREGARKLLQRLRDDLTAFTEATAAEDDRTVIIIKRT